MAGKIHKSLVFQPWRLCGICPIWWTIRMFIPYFLTRRKDCRDDTLLGMIVAEFAAEGIRFGPATDYVPELLVSEGQLTAAAPSAWQWNDIRFLARVSCEEMGGGDIGQSVAVRDQTVVAVEAVEGTDECIRRAGGLRCAGGFTLVKLLKPKQDMRFDAPTVGLNTVQTFGGRRWSRVGSRGWPHNSLDAPAAIHFAYRHSLAIVAVAAEKVLGLGS